MDPALTEDIVSTGILVVATLVLWVIIRRVGRAALLRVASRSGKPDAPARAMTLWGLLSRLLLVALGVFFVFTAAAIWGVPLGGLVAVGSAVGVALGLGAQTLVRDIIGGFFILAEGQYVIGDVVTISNVTGEVQQVRPRVTVLRDIDGNVYYVPNGSIVVSTNQSQEYADVVFDIGVAYDTDVDRVFALVKEELDAFTADSGMGRQVHGGGESARRRGVDRDHHGGAQRGQGTSHRAMDGEARGVPPAQAGAR